LKKETVELKKKKRWRRLILLLLLLWFHLLCSLAVPFEMALVPSFYGSSLFAIPSFPSSLLTLSEAFV
jgi:hypothetical protein